MTEAQAAPARRFEHEAYFYADLDTFVDEVGAYVRSGISRGDAVVVAVTEDKGTALRDALGTHGGDVTFLDIAVVGANPARIIPVWQQHLGHAGSAGRSVTGVGEPVWAARGADELVEAQRHETLLNLAFDGGSGWSLLCPYDVTALPTAVLDEAARSHPLLSGSGLRSASERYLASPRGQDQLDDLLPPPPPDAVTLDFGSHDFSAVRHHVAALAVAAGLQPDRVEDLVLAVHELATNSVRHGSGHSTVRAWGTSRSLVVEVIGAGRFTNPLLGREQPGLVEEGGRGLWLVQQLCDLVQMRNVGSDTVVRIHTRLP